MNYSAEAGSAILRVHVQCGEKKLPVKSFFSSSLVWLAAWVIVTAASSSAAAEPTLSGKHWNHGSENCATNSDPAIEVYRYSSFSFILRQNKCLSYEAPFMYLLLGDDRALLVDTGATEDAAEFPLYALVRTLVGDKELLVVHSHGHRDHSSADSQFQNLEGVTVVVLNKTGMMDALSISQWPAAHGIIDLGNRELVVIPTPGHQEEAITLYDLQTRWLLTGDTVYPGLIYVKHWDDYRDSIARLAKFSEKHEVSAVLGAHIEATNRPGDYYSVGTLYQPDEASLPIDASFLSTMNANLKQLPNSDELELGRLKIVPMNAVQRALSDFARWVRQ